MTGRIKPNVHCSREAPEPPATSSAAIHGAERALSSHSARVLIIDDVPANALELSLMLSAHGYSVKATGGAAQGLRSVETTPPDLILLSAGAPGSNRLAVCRRLKADPRSRDIPVIFVADRESSTERPEALRAGASDYICMPFIADEVLARIQIQVECGRARREYRKAETLSRWEEKLESLGDMANALAHNFNNIIQIMVSNAEFCLNDMPAESSARPRIMKILGAGMRATGVMKQVVACTGRCALSRQNVDLSSFIRELAPSLARTLPEGTPVRYDLQEGLPLLSADPAQLERMITNIMDNAVEAIGEEGSSISVSTGLMRLDEDFLAKPRLSWSAPRDLYATIRFCDTGCGMDRATRQRAFEPFFTTKGMGRGLGLSAVLGIAKRHDGAVKLESRPGFGTCVTVALPMDAPDGTE